VHQLPVESVGRQARRRWLRLLRLLGAQGLLGSNKNRIDFDLVLGPRETI
jgi:hypothetical protein